MRRLPAWFVYPWLLALLLFLAFARREKLDAPAPPPPLPAGASSELASTSPIDPAALVRVRPKPAANRGVAFSVGDAGVWLTAREVVADCAKPAVMVGDLDGLPATALGAAQGEVAAFGTIKGAPALPLAQAAPTPGSLAYVAGYPHGRPGEMALRLVDTRVLPAHARSAAPRTVLAWAPVGRTEGLRGSMAGLFGAPVIDGEGRVVAVALGEAPRRGLIYSTTPQALAAALASARIARPTLATGTVVTPDDYGLAGDELRRSLRIAPVGCGRS